MNEHQIDRRLSELRKAQNSRPAGQTKKKFNSQPEYQLQCAIVQWSHCNRRIYPGLNLLHCSLNGMKMTEAQAGRAKRAGMLAGVCDLFLPVSCGVYCGLYVEVKHGDNKPTRPQIEFMEAVREQGYKCAVVRCLDDFITVVREYYGV